jgi:hypothetical protein
MRQPFVNFRLGAVIRCAIHERPVWAKSTKNSGSVLAIANIQCRFGEGSCQLGGGSYIAYEEEQSLQLDQLRRYDWSSAFSTRPSACKRSWAEKSCVGFARG